MFPFVKVLPYLGVGGLLFFFYCYNNDTLGVRNFIKEDGLVHTSRVKSVMLVSAWVQ